MYKILKAETLEKLEQLVNNYKPVSNEKYEVIGVSIGGISVINDVLPSGKSVYVQSVYILTKDKIQTIMPNQ